MARRNSPFEEYQSKYKENGILINKRNIKNQSELDIYERNVTTYKLAQLFINPGKQTFDKEHYLRIHKYLFADIYPFAGQIRDETIQKKIIFCLPLYIEENLDNTLNKARDNMPLLDTREKLLEYIIELYADLDIIHPFMEGNGRTLREFIRQYIDYVCKLNNIEPFFLNYSKVKKEDYIKAVILADVCRYEELTKLFNDIATNKEMSDEDEYTYKKR